MVAIIAVVINTVFGVGMSLLLVRYEFPGKRLLSALIDLPLSVSPIVVGLALVLVYGGRDGWFGPSLEDHGFQVIFATPGHRPGHHLRGPAAGDPRGRARARGDRHRAGAGGPQPRRQRPSRPSAASPCPSIKWALVYGVVLSLARSLGEFGAVKVVSGNVLGETRTATLVVEEKYLNFDKGGAYATAFLLALVAVSCIVIVSLIRPKEKRK